MSIRKQMILSTLLVALAIPSSAQVTHVVDQTNLAFSPASITIEVGDTVRWVWSNLSHTVTSGTGAADANVGSLFDAPLNSANSVFEYTFTQAGIVPYFCRPHESFGMSGTVTVEVATDAPSAGVLPLLVHGIQPNPFNPRTTVRFSLGKDGPVSVRIYDSRGRLVTRLLDGVALDAGDQVLPWDGTDDSGRSVSSGTYHVLVRAAGLQQVVSAVLVR